MLLIARPQDEYLCRWAQADAWVVKPVDPFDLAEVLASIVDGDEVPALPGVGTLGHAPRLGPGGGTNADRTTLGGTRGEIPAHPSGPLVTSATTAAVVSWPALIERLLAGEELSAADTSAALTAVMSGGTSPTHLAAFLVALRAKGESTAEIAGLVRTMRRFALGVDVAGPTVDTLWNRWRQLGHVQHLHGRGGHRGGRGRAGRQARQPRGERALRLGGPARGVGGWRSI